jgi:hypothetical protein
MSKHVRTDPISANLLNFKITQPGTMREVLILSTYKKAGYKHAVTVK